MCMALMGVMSMGLGIMQAVASHQAQQDAADRQNQYYYQNAAAAQRAAVAQYANQNVSLLQKREAASQKVLETKIEGLKARGTARNASGEAGVSGLSVDALIGDYFGQESRRIQSIDTNYQMDRQYLLAEMEGTQAQAEQRINSVQRAAGPSGAALAIGIGSAVLGGAKSMFSGASTGGQAPAMSMGF